MAQTLEKVDSQSTLNPLMDEEGGDENPQTDSKEDDLIYSIFRNPTKVRGRFRSDMTIKRSGYLFKQKIGAFRKEWVKRFFVLRAGNQKPPTMEKVRFGGLHTQVVEASDEELSKSKYFLYFDDPTTRNPQGWIRLYKEIKMEVIEDPIDTGKASLHILRIESDDTIYELGAEGKEDLYEWMFSIYQDLTDFFISIKQQEEKKIQDEEAKKNEEEGGGDGKDEEGNEEKKEGNPNVMYTKDKGLKAGTLPALIEALTEETNMDCLNSSHVESFLLAHKAYASSYSLLKILIERFENTENSDVQLRVLMVIRAWIRCQPEELLEQKCHQRMRRFLDYHYAAFEENPVADPATKVMLADVTRVFGEMSMVDSTSRRSSAINNTTSTTTTDGNDESKDGDDSAPKDDGESGRGLMGNALQRLTSSASDGGERFFKRREIANQITIIEHELYINVQMDELLDQAWKSPDADRIAKYIFPFLLLFL